MAVMAAGFGDHNHLQFASAVGVGPNCHDVFYAKVLPRILAGAHDDGFLVHHIHEDIPVCFMTRRAPPSNTSDCNRGPLTRSGAKKI